MGDQLCRVSVLVVCIRLCIRYWDRYWDRFWDRFCIRFWDRYWDRFWDRYWERYCIRYWDRYWDRFCIRFWDRYWDRFCIRFWDRYWDRGQRIGDDDHVRLGSKRLKPRRPPVEPYLVLLLWQRVTHLTRLSTLQARRPILPCSTFRSQSPSPSWLIQENSRPSEFPPHYYALLRRRFPKSPELATPERERGGSAAGAEQNEVPSQAEDSMGTDAGGGGNRRPACSRRTFVLAAQDATYAADTRVRREVATQSCDTTVRREVAPRSCDTRVRHNGATRSCDKKLGHKGATQGCDAKLGRAER